MPAIATLPATARRLAAPAVATALLAAAAAFLGLAGEASRAQGGAIRLDVSMGHHALAWQGEPGAAYTVRLSNPNAIDDHSPDGEKAFGTAQADPSGAARVLLHWRTNVFYYRAVEPGDRLEVALADGPTLLDLVVPDVGADVSDDGARVAGRAPAGAPVTITLEAEGDQPPFRQVVVADGDGAFALDLPADLHLAEGAGGTATFVDAAGHRYTDVFARRHVELTMDSAHIATRSSQQAPIGAARTVIVSGRSVLRPFNARYPSPDGLTFDGRRLLVGDDEAAVGAGDVVTFTQGGGPLRRTNAWVRTLPDLAIYFDGDRVVGRAPAGAVLAVETGAPDQPAALTAQATADDAGDFALDLPSGLRPEAGWWADARLDTGDGIWLRAGTIVPRIEASVNGAHVGIDMQPFQPVTLTLTGPAGEARYHRAHRAGNTGRLDVQLTAEPTGRPPYVALRPGDRLSVALDAGDPLVFTIPSLVARTDPDAEAISGTAPGGDEVHVAIVDGEETLQRTARADGDGRWTLDAAGDVDLEPGVYARVEWLDRGHRFYAYTAAQSIEMALNNNSVETWPYVGYPMTITLATADGRLVASASVPLGQVEAPDLAHGNHRGARDRFDGSEMPRPGDVLTVAVGADSATLIVPPLDVRAHVADDLVLGSTLPGGRVQLRTGYSPREGTTLAEVVADTNGALRFELGTTHDLAYNDRLFASLALGRHLVLRQLDVPGLTLDFDRAVLDGVLEPDVPVTARVGAPAAPIASAHAVADLLGGFSLLLVGPDGRVPALPAGEPIALDAPAATLYPRLEWAVPDVVLEEARAAIVAGTAPPGSVIHAERRASILGPWRPSAESSVEVSTGADGRWEVDLRSEPVPGWMTTVTVDLPDGHRAVRRDVVPIVRAHRGTPQVCGIGMPWQAVHLELRDDAGALLGTALGSTDVEGRFDLGLADSDGSPVLLDTGHRLSARVGEAPIGLTIGPLEGLSLVNRRASARVLPKALVQVVATSRSCLDEHLADALAGGLSAGSRNTSRGWLRADDQGLVSTMPLLPGIVAYGYSVVVFTPDGQSYMGTYLPAPFGTAYADADRVAGLAGPGARVAVRLEDPAGALRGAGEAIAAEDGRFDVRLVAEDGSSVLIRPGDVVVLEAGDGISRFTVEPLAFDFSVGSGLAVTAPPDRPIIVRFGVGGRVETLAERADAEGRFAFRPDEVPPRAGWTLDEVTEVEVLLMQPGEHATGYAWAAEGDGGRTVWLPWGGR